MGGAKNAKMQKMSFFFYLYILLRLLRGLLVSLRESGKSEWKHEINIIIFSDANIEAMGHWPCQ